MKWGFEVTSGPNALYPCFSNGLVLGVVSVMRGRLREEKKRKREEEEKRLEEEERERREKVLTSARDEKVRESAVTTKGDKSVKEESTKDEKKAPKSEEQVSEREVRHVPSHATTTSDIPSCFYMRPSCDQLS